MHGSVCGCFRVLILVDFLFNCMSLVLELFSDLKQVPLLFLVRVDVMDIVGS